VKQSSFRLQDAILLKSRL